MTRRRAVDDDRGFTLVELLVAITILSIIGAVVTTSVVRSLQTTTAATARIEALTSVERVQERMGRQIRAADPLLTATATTLSLRTRDNTRRYAYTYVHDAAAGTITQTVATFPTLTATTATSTVTTTVARDVATGGAPVFAYFDATDTATTAATPVANIRRVQITIGRTIAGGPPLTIRTSVFPRNSARTVTT